MDLESFWRANRMGLHGKAGLVRSTVLAMVLVDASVAFGADETDWYLSVYSPKGIEVRSDERTFELFALFNAAGLDEGQKTVPRPLAQIEYAPIRATIRRAIAQSQAGLGDAAKAFLASHPGSVADYVDTLLGAVTRSNRSPIDAQSIVEPRNRDAFELLVTKAKTAFNTHAVFADSIETQRSAVRTLAGSVDGLLEPLTKRLGDVKPARFEVVFNPLDVPGEVRRVRRSDGSWLMLAAPLQSGTEVGIVREAAAMSIDKQCHALASKWSAGAEVLALAQAIGAPDTSVSEYLCSLLSTALALNSVGAEEAVFERLQAKGYFGLKEAAKVLNEAKSLEIGLSEAVSRIDARRTGKK